MRVLSSSPDKAFALTGEVEGRRMIFVLKNGVTLLAGGRECDIVLSSPGVSERHAVVEVGSDEINVRDLASKNGTFLGGQRISSCSIGIGEVVQFGPVILQIEGVDPEDAFLSVTARRDNRVAATRSVENNTSTVAWSGAVDGLRSRRWLRLLDEVTGELSSGTDTALGRALATLSRGLEATGATLLSLPSEGSPIVLASFGGLPGDLPVRAKTGEKLHQVAQLLTFNSQSM